MARVLTIEEYAKLAAKTLDRDKVEPQEVAQMRQVHRLLCDGHKVEDLTPTEQRYASAFEGANCVQIPNDYGWEPGIEVAEKAEAKPSKPKKEDK